MKTFLYKSSSLLMAFVVLVSTMSFTIDKHYCGSILVDVAINTKAKTCGMEMAMSPEDMRSGKKSCCKNEHIVIVGQDELKKSFENGLQFQWETIITEEQVFCPECIQVSPLFIALGNHDPPDIRQDLQKLYETYLI